jgi:hypothetical protein
VGWTHELLALVQVLLLAFCRGAPADDRDRRRLERIAAYLTVRMLRG